MQSISLVNAFGQICCEKARAAQDNEEEMPAGPIDVTISADNLPIRLFLRTQNPCRREPWTSQAVVPVHASVPCGRLATIPAFDVYRNNVNAVIFPVAHRRRVMPQQAKRMFSFSRVNSEAICPSPAPGYRLFSFNNPTESDRGAQTFPDHLARFRMPPGSPFAPLDRRPGPVCR